MVSVFSLNDDFLTCSNSPLKHVVNQQFFLLFAEMVEKERVHENEENFHFGGLVFGSVSLFQGDFITFVERTVYFRADGGSDFSSSAGDSSEPPDLKLFIRDIFENVVIAAIVWVFWFFAIPEPANAVIKEVFGTVLDEVEDEGFEGRVDFGVEVFFELFLVVH